MNYFKPATAEFTSTAFAITRAILQIVNVPVLLTIVFGLLGFAFLAATMFHLGGAAIAAVSSLP